MRSIRSVLIGFVAIVALSACTTSVSIEKSPNRTPTMTAVIVTPAPTLSPRPSPTATDEPISSATSAPTPMHSTMPSDSAEVQPNADVLASYRAVLQSQAEFIDESGVGRTMAQLNEVVSSDEVTAELARFTVLDLDHDGSVEMILAVNVFGNSYGVLILRYQGGTVYGFPLWDRAFSDLRTDGTFWASGGAADVSICTITFDKNAYEVSRLAYSEGVDADDSFRVAYYVNDESVTEKEWRAAVASWRALPEAIWHEYTDENVEEMLHFAS